jgi:hypothetical protein
VALAEGDEHPDQLALRVAGDLEDESEGALLGGRVDEGQIELRAVRELGAIRAQRLARKKVGQCHPALFGLRPARWSRSEASGPRSRDRLTPNRVVKAHR